MSDSMSPAVLDTAVEKLESAAGEGKITAGAVTNIRQWLSEAKYATYAAPIVQHINDGMWQELDDAFWTIIPFGTGGRRGRMYAFGSNAINERTIGESAQGLAEYVLENRDDEGELSCAIAYDTRHRSREFAELCAGVMVAAGFKVYLMDDYRSTPALSFLVRYKNCSCGIMVTASHNPPSDNAVKVYWSTGGQLVPPHDKAVIERVMKVDELKFTPFQQALDNGDVLIVTEEVDAAFTREVKAQSFDGPRDLKLIYSPLHGVGESAVRPVLEADGFEGLEIYEPHRKPDGDFPNVPGHVSNPENPRVFDAIIDRAKETGAELILASDPDCDRLGCAAPHTLDTAGDWGTFTGNQIGALLADYVLEKRSQGGGLSTDHYVVKTLVTTEMIRRIAESYGVKTYGNLLVGFKWIGEVIDQQDPAKFVFGAEESHGYLVGQYARDKDGAVASMLMAELAAHVKAQGKSLHEKLGDLYWQHGYHAEHLLNVQMEGSDGMAKMQSLMKAFRDNPPTELAGLKVTAVRDYANGKTIVPGGGTETLDGPTGNMVILDLSADGNYVAVRPSGTEPKVKFYMFTFTPAEQLADLEMTGAEMKQRIEGFEADLRKFASEV